MNLTTVVVGGIGGVLIYSAVKGYDPRDVFRTALRAEQSPTVKYPIGSGSAPAEPQYYVPPGSPDDGRQPPRNPTQDTPDTSVEV